MQAVGGVKALVLSIVLALDGSDDGRAAPREGEGYGKSNPKHVLTPSGRREVLSLDICTMV